MPYIWTDRCRASGSLESARVRRDDQAARSMSQANTNWCCGKSIKSCQMPAHASACKLLTYHTQGCFSLRHSALSLRNRLVKILPESLHVLSTGTQTSDGCAETAHMYSHIDSVPTPMHVLPKRCPARRSYLAYHYIECGGFIADDHLSI